MLFNVGYILRMSGSLIILCVCLFMHGDDLYLGVVLNTEEILPNFKKMSCVWLAKGSVPYALDTPRFWVVTNPPNVKVVQNEAN